MLNLLFIRNSTGYIYIYIYIYIQRLVFIVEFMIGSLATGIISFMNF